MVEDRVSGGDTVVVLPLGATEQHGPHLPASTDVDIGRGILEDALVRVRGEVPTDVLPFVDIGASEEHLSFPATESVRAEDLVARLEEIGEEVAESGRRRLVLVNSHGGNRFAMDTAALRLRRKHGMLVVKASWFRFERPDQVVLPKGEWLHGLHGGAVETAMMMHLHPERVRADAITDFLSLGAELEQTLRRLGPEGEASFAWLAEDLHPAGVVGDPRHASAELGARLVAHYGAVLADVLRDAHDFPLDRLVDAREGR